MVEYDQEACTPFEVSREGSIPCCLQASGIDLGTLWSIETSLQSLPLLSHDILLVNLRLLSFYEDNSHIG